MAFSIKSAIKQWFPDQVNGYRLYRDLVRNRESYLHTTGWLRSVAAAQPLGSAGEPVPWMNYPVVRLLERRLPADVAIYEYGSGNSTAFWARRAARVVSLEYDKAWLDRISAGVPANATLHFCPQDRDGAYCRHIATVGQSFDLVVVDGRDRVNCVKQSLPNLTARGVVLLDDSQREKYSGAFEFMREAGFSALSIEGLKPTGLGADETTLFYRPGNCLGL